MIEKVKKTIDKFGLLKKGERILLAVSGGADSVALAHVMHRLKEEYEITLHIAHLNHMLRGEEAERDARFASTFAQKLGIHCTVGRADAAQLAEKEKLSLEEAARKVRYEFLANTAEKVGAAKIAVGHNADDRAETLLLHLLRGTGPEGLEGIRPKYKNVIRPLLEVTREEIERYCSEHRLSFVWDSTNEEVIYTRNKIRHDLLPVLKGYNPNIVKALNRTAEILLFENEYMDLETRKVFKEVVISEKDGGKLILPIKKFTPLHKALQRRIIRHCWTWVTGIEEGLEYKHVERVRNFIYKGSTGKKLVLPCSAAAYKTYEAVTFIKEDFEKKKEGIRYQREIKVPGTTLIPETGALLKAEILNVGEVGRQYLFSPPETAYMDLNKLELPLFVRSRTDGDGYNPLGLKGRKKIKDILIDAKVPREEREKIPVVLDQKGIVWFAGFRIDERVKITENTQKILHIDYITN
ncbi:MAG: tRNA lysidine(34) synthetase TilS [Clostridia bacterium]|nr:tRNA lysidine(34) synthetase TilS [Clostridia bacterium]